MCERLGGIEPATDEAEHRELQAESNAAAICAYGLDRADTTVALDGFHQVENPRLMDDASFELARKKDDELAEEGPLPERGNSLDRRLRITRTR